MAAKILVVFLALCTLAAAQQAEKPKPAEAPLTVAISMDRQLGGVEKGFIAAVEAMPDDQFEFAPPAGAGEFKGVRTFGDQVRHVTAGLFVFSAMLNGETPQHAKSIDDMVKGVPAKGKAETLAMLKEAFASAHKAMQTLTPENLTERLQFPFNESKMSRISCANIMLWHTMDHYGQMMIYLRMNGIVPPASRQS